MVQTKGKNISKHSIKISALIVMFILFFSIVPIDTNAGAPTPYAFNSYDSEGNVDLSTGDMILSIPLFSVPQPGGAPYPITLSYKAGIKLDQGASWVGLGWGLDVDGITRSVNNVPDDTLPDTNNYRLDANYPSKYPASKFKQQMDQAEEARKKSRISTAVGIGMSIAAAIATGGLTAAVAPGAIMNSFSANMISSGINTGINEAEMSGSMNDLKDQYKAIKHHLDLTSDEASSKAIDGMIYSDVSEFQSTDFQNPDTYFVSSIGYSGPLTLIKNEDNPNAEAFIPHSYKGDLFGYYGTEVHIDGGQYGYLKTYHNAMKTDTATRIITDLDLTTGSETTIEGFELVDVSGKHYIFDEVTEKQISSSLAGFHPVISGVTAPTSFADFSWNNRYPGDISNSHEPDNLYSDGSGLLGSASYILTDYVTGWGITSITGPTFSDTNPTGEVDPTDTGSWVKFNYCDVASGNGCPQGTPILSDNAFTVSNSQRVKTSGNYYGFDEDFDVTSGGQKFISRSFKEYKYLESIETYSHKADFIVDFDRNDASEVYSSGVLDNQPKLDSIILQQRISPGVDSWKDLEKYEFEYDYSLVYGAPDNKLFAEGDCSQSNWDDCGRLTLKSVTHFVCNDWNSDGSCDVSGWNSDVPMEFEYANNDAVQSEVFDGSDCSSFNTQAYPDPQADFYYCDSAACSNDNSCYCQSYGECECGNEIGGSSWPIEDCSDCSKGPGSTCECVPNEFCVCSNLNELFDEPHRLSSILFSNDNPSFNFFNKNPPYIRDAYDRWGYPFYAGHTLNNVHNHKGVPNPNVDSWSLTKIYWPTGGTVEWSYEEDRYTRLNDYYSDPVGNIEKQDTHFGGGLRVRSVKYCDGLSDCYTKGYAYNIKDSNEFVSSDLDNEYSGVGVTNTPGDSSGVALGEPKFPIYAKNFESLLFSPERSVIEGGMSSVIYSKVQTYFDNDNNDNLEYGITEHKFTTPLIYPAEGKYTSDKIFDSYDPDGCSSSKDDCNPSSEEYPIGADFVILEGIGDDDINNLLVKENEPYLVVSSNIEGYLFFIRSKTKTNSGGCGELFYDAVCHNRVKVHHPIDKVPVLDQTCPGYEESDVGPYCGTIVLEDRGAPSSGSWSANCDCKDPGYRVIFCDKNQVDSDVGELETLSNWQSVVETNLRLDSWDEDHSIDWDFNWDQFCYQIYGGEGEHDSWDSGETWGYSNIDTNPCIDWNNDNNCDLLQQDNPDIGIISMNTVIPGYKYGLNYETNSYSAEDLSNPINSIQNEYVFPFDQSYLRSTMQVGAAEVISTVTVNDGLETTITYPELEIDEKTGIPTVVETENSDGKIIRSTTVLVSADTSYNDDANFGVDEYHILNAVSMTITQDLLMPMYHDVIAASLIEYGDPFNLRSDSVHLPAKQYIWKDESDSSNYIDTDDEDFDDEWQLTSKITEYDDIFLRPLAVEDAEGKVVKTYYGGSASGECSGQFGLYPTCVETYIGDEERQIRSFYDDRGRVKKIQDANEVESHFYYDEYNRLIASSFDNDTFNMTEYEYNFALDNCNALNPNNDNCLNWVETKTRMNPNDESTTRSYVDGLGRGMQTSAFKDIAKTVAVVSGQKFYNDRGLIDNISSPFVAAVNSRSGGGLTLFDYPSVNSREDGGDEDSVKYVYENNPSARVERVFPLAVYDPSRSNFNCGDDNICTQFEHGSCADVTSSICGDYANDEDYHWEKVIDAMGKSVVSVSDKFGRTLLTIDPDGNQASATYDSLGRVETSTNALGQVNRFTYNTLSQLINSTDIDSGTALMKYDELGRVTNAWNENGVEIFNDYDDLSRLVRVYLCEDVDANAFGGCSNTDFLILENFYDVNSDNEVCVEDLETSYGYLCEIIDSSQDRNTSLRYNYDKRGNIVSVTEQTGGWSYTTEYEYNDAGMVTKVTTLKDGVEVIYNYDLLGQTTSIEFGGQTINYYYFDDVNDSNVGKLNRIDFPNEDVGSVGYSYNERGWLETIISNKGFFGESYMYDVVGNLNRLTEPSTGADVIFQYDNLYRLSAVIDQADTSPENYYDASGQGLYIDYEFDEIGNRLERNVLGNTDLVKSDTYLYGYMLGGNNGLEAGGNNQLLETDNCIYNYDAVGNLVFTDCSHEGNLVRNSGFETNDGVIPSDWYNNGVGDFTLIDGAGRNGSIGYEVVGGNQNSYIFTPGYIVEVDRLGRNVIPGGNINISDNGVTGSVWAKASEETPITIYFSFGCANVQLGGPSEFIVDDDWQRLSFTAVPEEGLCTDGYSASIYLFVQPDSTVVFDDAMIEKSSFTTDYVSSYTEFNFDALNRLKNITLPDGSTEEYRYYPAGGRAYKKHNKVLRYSELIFNPGYNWVSFPLNSPIGKPISYYSYGLGSTQPILDEFKLSHHFHPGLENLTAELNISTQIMNSLPVVGVVTKNGTVNSTRGEFDNFGISPAEGYVVQADESLRENTQIEIYGESFKFTPTTDLVSDEWNLIGNPSVTDANINSLVGSISDNLIGVRSQTESVINYRPKEGNLWLGSLNNIEFSSAFKVMVNEDLNFNFGGSANKIITPEPLYDYSNFSFEVPKNMKDNMVVLVNFSGYQPNNTVVPVVVSGKGALGGLKSVGIVYDIGNQIYEPKPKVPAVVGMAISETDIKDEVKEEKKENIFSIIKDFFIKDDEVVKIVPKPLTHYTIVGNHDGEIMNFGLFDEATKQIVVCEPAISFESGALMGDVNEPFQVYCGEEGRDLINEINMTINVTTNLSRNVTTNITTNVSINLTNNTKTCIESMESLFKSAFAELEVYKKSVINANMDLDVNVYSTKLIVMEKSCYDDCSNTCDDRTIVSSCEKVVQDFFNKLPKVNVTSELDFKSRFDEFLVVTVKDVGTQFSSFEKTFSGDSDCYNKYYKETNALIEESLSIAVCGGSSTETDYSTCIKVVEIEIDNLFNSFVKTVEASCIKGELDFTLEFKSFLTGFKKDINTKLVMFEKSFEGDVNCYDKYYDDISLNVDKLLSGATCAKSLTEDAYKTCVRKLDSDFNTLYSSFTKKVNSVCVKEEIILPIGKEDPIVDSELSPEKEDLIVDSELSSEKEPEVKVVVGVDAKEAVNIGGKAFYLGVGEPSPIDFSPVWDWIVNLFGGK